ncbi:MBL fold metallo-hydrolase RNA specificity domain-containing protein [Caldisalinibacter kiritimatiensis]|uniref:Metallo-beta-lactamase family protein, RNA-specific n=1 Tax=Caldisalinibacter kiritimatiensis TaxID=1304284 RepID=R1ASY4_9FIRM|nr:MBL fold metallo-hydrolase [Caldisalinibacter kiritimatiensis]EOD00258.1 Metallo-beta-lactamase family protein, RNA-specific [Caldisalinibacter kiritimatiensis]
MKIKFLGASQVVTGSNYLITTDKYKILIDCGLFQGSKELERLNFEDFQFVPEEIDFLFLSHAHIDHSGRIPKLVKEGFNGKIVCTKATKDLCDIMLVDSGHIQETDAKWENNKRKRAGKPLIEPLYTAEDAVKSLNYFTTALYGQKIDINEDITVRFRDAGHILGSSIIELWITEKGKEIKIVFSGDLGMKDRPIIRDPEIIEDADYLIIESTYGDRLHEDVEVRAEKLVDIINKTVSRGGTVVIPSFAVGRTQELIYELNKYYEYNNNIEEFMRIPIYIDSPMAVSATDTFRKNSDCFDEEAKKLILGGDNPFEFTNLHYIRSQEESIKLNKSIYPKVIISASGMCTAGRVRHHLKYNLWKGRNSVIFVGYQAEGTLGRLLKDGVKRVKLLGEQVIVEAEIHSIEGFSAHADRDGLVDWLKGFKKLPSKVFVVHGEKEASHSFAETISEKFKVETIVPNIGDVFELSCEFSKCYSGEVMVPLKQKESIKKELQQVYDEFESIVSRTNKLLDTEFLKSDYDNLKNSLIELHQKLMDINILLGE